MPSVGRPDVDALRNLSAAIVVDQERMGANSRSTVGTATDAYTMLRIVFSRLGTPLVGTSSAFSFNHPEGMCPECEGLGRVRHQARRQFPRAAEERAVTAADLVGGDPEALADHPAGPAGNPARPLNLLLQLRSFAGGAVT